MTGNTKSRGDDVLSGTGRCRLSSAGPRTRPEDKLLRSGLPVRIAGLVPMLMLAAALCFGYVGQVRGQSPASEGVQIGAPPAAETTASPAGKENEPIPAPKAVAPPEPPLSESELWARRLKELIDGIEASKKEPEDADALYAKLAPVLQARRQELREALRWARSPEALIEKTPNEEMPEATLDKPVTGQAEPDASHKPKSKLADEVRTLAELRDTVAALYRTRILLLQYVTPEFRAAVTGVGRTGVRELNGEMMQLILNTRYKALSIPAKVAVWPKMVKEAPLPLVFGVAEFFIVLIIFRWWRSWVPGALTRLHDNLLAARPRRRRNLRLARFLWYLDRVRHPLEWLIVLTVLVGIIDAPIHDNLKNAPLTAIQWFLLAWFAVNLINSLVTRDAAGTTAGITRLRIGSLRMVAAWLVLLGLGLELATEYAGHGTIHAWVWLLFEVLTLPLLVLLIILWQSRIFQLLDLAPRVPAWVERMLKHRQGLKGFASAAGGGLYLICLSLQRRLFEAMSQMDWGQRTLAELDARALVRAREHRQDVGEPISAELRDRLIAGPAEFVEKIARSELAQLAELVNSGNGGLAVIIAEHGGGKTTLLQRLASKFDGQALVIDCPVDGYKAFRDVFARSLKLNTKEISAETLARRLKRSEIRVVALDNIHRLFRPMKGGQKEWDQVSNLVHAVTENIVWIFTLNRAAWQYTNLMRGGRLFLGELVELSRLTEEQLSDLINLSCTEAGIDPDFTKLLLPRQTDGTGQQTADELSRNQFTRVLWNASGGNPREALRLWAKSLVTVEDGGIEVRLPEQPALLEVERLDITGQLVLRVITQCELASPEEIIQSLRLPEIEANAAITALLQRGWIEELDGRYRMSWSWWRAITRVLVRKNLLPRSL